MSNLRNCLCLVASVLLAGCLPIGLPKAPPQAEVSALEILGESIFDAQSARVSSLLADDLARARDKRIPGSPSVFLTPGSGTRLSRQSMAYVYRHLAARPEVRTVILLSSAEGAGGRGVRVLRRGWNSPLGEVKINALIANKLLASDTFLPSDAPLPKHLQIHALFVKQSLPGALIVPVLIEPASHVEIRAAAERLAAVVRADGTVLVAVSDLSSNPLHPRTTTGVDRQTLASLHTMSVYEIDRVRRTLRDRASPQVIDTMSAPWAVLCATHVCDLLNLDTATFLDYVYSGAPQGGPMYIGHAAVAFSARHRKLVPWINTDDAVARAPRRERSQLGKAAVRELLKIAREAAESAVVHARYEAAEPRHRELRDTLPVFVTLFDAEGVRGSMGTLETPLPLHQGVAEAARAAATEDPYRFSEPLSAEQARTSEILVSVVRDVTPVGNWRTIRPGVDGVVVQRGTRGAVVLPMIAEWEGLDAEGMCRRACLQAGLRADAYRDGAALLYTFKTDEYSTAPFKKD